MICGKIYVVEIIIVVDGELVSCRLWVRLFGTDPHKKAITLIVFPAKHLLIEWMDRNFLRSFISSKFCTLSITHILNCHTFLFGILLQAATSGAPSSLAAVSHRPLREFAAEIHADRERVGRAQCGGLGACGQGSRLGEGQGSSKKPLLTCRFRVENPWAAPSLPGKHR